MKYLFYLIIILFLSCNQNKSVNKDKSVFFTEGSVHLSQDFIDEIVKEVSDSIISKNSEIQDCYFDQTNQTDFFLKGIEELSGYSWNSETKTAEIILNNCRLAIKRGGCDLVELSAKFSFDKALNFEEDKDLIFNQIIWITSLLEEFEGEAIKECIENRKISITKEEDNKYYVNFMDVKVYEGYILSFESTESYTFFSIAYYFG